MAQLIVRNIEEQVKAGIKRLADIHGRSMEEEIRDILRNAVMKQSKLPLKLGTRIAARFKKAELSKDLPELRGQPARAIDFEK